MKLPQDLKIEDFDYPLPPERIAQFPPEQRDSSKMVIWRKGEISDTVFSSVDNYLPENSLLVFNNTKVIRARLIFTKDTGATIEIFCLEPLGPTSELQLAFAQKQECIWCCLVGNAKRWKSGILHKVIRNGNNSCTLTAENTEDLHDGHFRIRFTWEPASLTFSEILERSGHVPLPPYITRGDSDADLSRYQTVYAEHEGSVAAPTAGLHFTNEVMERLGKKGITFQDVALHVGVGTFRPVTVPDLADHVMHSEKIVVSADAVRKLIRQTGKPVVAVGTTSVRTLESLYWLGVKILSGETDPLPGILQWDPYNERYPADIPAHTALDALDDFLTRNRLEYYAGSTQLMIVPGYRFRIVDTMITNFHMPQSTLLLLIAAFIGEDWKKVYEHALSQEFRFLSYGDACLFFRREEPFA